MIWRRLRDERGFTLVELLMATVIMGVIVAPLTAGLIVGLRTSEDSSNRLRSSNDAQLLSMWFPPDVQSAGNQSGDVVASPTANTECSGVTNLLRLRWRETQATTTTYEVAYATALGLDGSWRLVRYACTDGGAPTTHVVARNLADASGATVSLSGQWVCLRVNAAGTETEPGYTYTVSGVRRLAATSTTIAGSCPTTPTSTTTTSTTAPSGMPNLAGILFTNTSSGLWCDYDYPNVICITGDLGDRGTFSGKVTLVDSNQNPLANTTGAAITANASLWSLDEAGGTLNPPTSSTIAVGATTTADAFSMTGNGAQWAAVMWATVTIGGNTYTVAVVGWGGYS